MELLELNSFNEIKEKKQWVCWKKTERNNGKIGKMPISPATGTAAKANDASTWSSFTEAVEAQEKYECDGIGLELEGSGLVGIDIDDCIDADGKLSETAASIVAAVDSYTELSPSRRGVHILVKADLNIGKRNNAVGLEVYSTKRFFTVTGNVYDGYNNIRKINGNKLCGILDPYLSLPVDTQVEDTGTKEISCEMTINEEDARVLEKAFRSKRGKTIEDLFNGEISEYNNDHSAADMALVNHLVYWCNGDAEQVDRIFRSSALFRKKWDEKHGAMTYGELTIAKAIEQSFAFTDDKNINTVEALCPDTQQTEHHNTYDDLFTRPGDYLSNGMFDAMIAEQQNFAARKTGFCNMDEKVSLYPGLYALGATSSLGKTTFISQMADQLSAAGVNVLFFSLEQNKFEMISKGVARANARLVLEEGEDIFNVPSAIDIRAGQSVSEHMSEAVERYADETKNEYIIGGSFKMNVERIIDITKKFMGSHKEDAPPVIIIDYLQVVVPANGASVRENVDTIVQRLKQFQKDTNVTIIIISSFNRANYAAQVSFESFKESGGIEYTCDVIWGMQLACIDTNEAFDSDKATNSKRKILNEAKGENPRKIELVVLKNRYGSINDKFFFDYYPHCDLYVPATEQIIIEE